MLLTRVTSRRGDHGNVFHCQNKVLHVLTKEQGMQDFILPAMKLSVRSADNAGGVSYCLKNKNDAVKLVGGLEALC